jgi:copper homeostasis protein
MYQPLSLEICAYDLASCLIAEKAGAARIELCADLKQGGTTPSYGLIRQARELVSIPLVPIIRPRAGGFCYSADELMIMMHDIDICKQLSCDGISVGVLSRTGEIDTTSMKRIADRAYPMSVACHRAFDMTPDAVKALEDLTSCGCVRILTSGQKAKAIDAIDLLTSLVRIAAGRISIMPGGGVRSSNISQLKATGATEFHSSALLSYSAGSVTDTIMDLGDLSMADEKEIRAMIELL